MTRDSTIAALIDAGCNQAEVTEALSRLPLTPDVEDAFERDVDAYVAASVRASLLARIPQGDALAALYGKRAA
jgi:hypothetical protein